MNGLNLKLILEAVDRITGPVRHIKNKLVDTFKAATAGAKELAEQMERAGKKASQTGGFLTSRVTLPMLGMGALSIRAAGQVEELTMQLEHLAGGADQARAFMQSLQGHIDKFGTEELSASVRLMETAGYSMDEMRKRLNIIGDVAAGSHTPLAALTDQYIELRKAGKVSDGDLASMMKANIPIVAELAKQLGKTEKQIWNMSAEGKITFEQYRKALAGLTEEGGRFNGAMDRHGRSINGVFTELRNSIHSVMAELGAGLWEDLDIAPKIKALSSAVRGLVEGFLGLPKWLKSSITWLALFLAVVGPVLMVIGQVTIGIGGLLFAFAKLPLLIAAATQALRSFLLINTVVAAVGNFITAIRAGYTVMQAFNLVLLANPIGLIIIAITALVAAGYMLWKHWDKIKAFFNGLWGGLSNNFKVGIKIALTLMMPFIMIPLQIIRNWGKISGFFSSLWSGITSVFQESISAIMEYLQPLIDAVNLVVGGLSRIGRGIGEKISGSWSNVTNDPSQPTGPAAPGTVAPAPGGMRTGKVDAGGVIKIQIDQNNRARVSDTRSNDSRVKYQPADTGQLMGGF